MKFVKKTRRYFIFESNLCPEGIKGDGEYLYFPRASWKAHRFKGLITFNTVNECEKFIAESFTMKKYEKILHNIKSKSIKVTGDEWEKIRKFVINEDVIENPETDIAAFEALLANNFKDRDNERFSKDVLQAFGKTIVGKSKLMSHNWSTPGNGKFYEADLAKFSVDDIMSMIDTPHNDFKEHLKFVENRDGGIYFLRVRYYMPNITATQKESVLNIAMGIWSDMSIGFRAPSRKPVYENDDKNSDNILFYEYLNTENETAEALEGSHVGVPAQYGAQTVKKNLEQYKGAKDNLFEIIIHDKRDLSNLYETEIGDVKKHFLIYGKDKKGDTCLASVWYKLDEWGIDEAKKHFRDNYGNIESINEEEKGLKVWSSAYINSLEDNCFAFVENTGNKDEEGRTIPKSARHLPHHPKGGGASGTGGKVDVPHLRNALARVNQIKPVTDKYTATEMRTKAKKHLIAHAKKLGVGDYERSIEMEVFEFKSLDLKVTVDDMTDEIKQLLEKIDAVAKDKIEETNAVIEVLKNERDDLKAKTTDMQLQIDELSETVNQFKKVFGDELNLDVIKRVKETADNYRKSLEEDYIKFGKLSKMFTDDELEQVREDVKEMKDEQLVRLTETYKRILKEQDPKGFFDDDDEDDKEKDEKRLFRKESVMEF